MILFCDTSALIKLYIREDFSDRMMAAAEAASATAVCRIAWAEAMAALAASPGIHRPKNDSKTKISAGVSFMYPAFSNSTTHNPQPCQAQHPVHQPLVEVANAPARSKPGLRNSTTNNTRNQAKPGTRFTTRS